MARLDPATLPLGANLDAYLAAWALDGSRLPDGRIVNGVRQSFDRQGLMTQTQTVIKAAGWSPSSSDVDLEGLRTLLVARGVVIPSSGSKISRLRSIIDQLAVTAEA